MAEGKLRKTEITSSTTGINQRERERQKDCDMVEGDRKEIGKEVERKKRRREGEGN